MSSISAPPASCAIPISSCTTARPRAGGSSSPAKPLSERSTGTELKLVPARLESFAQFKARHPGGKVLVPNDPGLRDYGRNPYVGYDMAAAPFLYRGDYPKDVEAMARVVVVRPAPGKIGAVTLEHLRKKGQLALGDVELTWQPGQSTALDHWDIAQGRDVGSVIATMKGARRPATRCALRRDLCLCRVRLPSRSRHREGLASTLVASFWLCRSGCRCNAMSTELPQRRCRMRL